MSMLFNAAFYLDKNPDVLLAIAQKKIASAEAHFNEFGAFEGRNPNAFFDTKSYFKSNPDVLTSGMNPLDHFLKFGAAEGRSPSATFVTKAQFDTVAYAAANPDLATAGITTPAALYEHFAKFGFSEARTGMQTTNGVAITDGVSGGAVGTTFTLTSGTDTLTGTASADTFNADLINEGGVANVTSLNSTDNINGGNGADTLTATYDDAVSATISNVETLNLSGRAAVAFDFINVTGVTDINIAASSAAVDLNNIAAVPANINISNQSQDVDLDFAAAAVAGAADVATISVASMTAGTLTVDTGIETVALTSKGSTANVIADLTTGTPTTGAKSVTIAGSQDLTITATLDASVATINAATATGKVNVTQTNAVAATITGGKGADTITLGASYVGGAAGTANVDTVNGGDGIDKLSLTSATASGTTVVQANVSNFEVLDVSNALAGNVNALHFGVNTVELSAGIDATDRTITLASTNTIDLEADAGNDLSINVAGVSTTDVVNLILDNADIAANLQAGNVETLNITSTGTADGGQNTITGTTAVNSTAAVESIVITGAEALTFTGVVTADIINGSAMTDILTLTAGTAGSATVTGGSANDVLNISNGLADIVNGGAGADVITFDIEAADILTGGAGADTFTMDNDTDVTFAGATIIDLATIDNVDLDESTLETNTVGGAAIAELTDFAGNDITGAQDLTFVSISADNTALTTGDIGVITGKTYADLAAVLTDIGTAGARTFTAASNYDDEDGVLLAYELTSGGTQIALFAHNGGGNASSNSMDAADVVITLSGVSATSLQTMNFDLVT
jgi:hypothetical protein